MSEIEEICKPILGRYWMAKLSRLDCGIKYGQIHRIKAGRAQLSPNRRMAIHNALQRYLNTPDETIGFLDVKPTKWTESTEFPGLFFRIRSESGLLLLDIRNAHKDT